MLLHTNLKNYSILLFFIPFLYFTKSLLKKKIDNNCHNLKDTYLNRYTIIIYDKNNLTKQFLYKILVINETKYLYFLESLIECNIHIIDNDEKWKNIIYNFTGSICILNS